MEKKNTVVEITPFLLGPIENNTYLIHDPVSHEAVVIDPSFDIQPVIDHIRQADLRVKYLLITHAHFDHIAGVNELLANLPAKLIVALHPADLDIWRNRGEALHYGFQMNPLSDPDFLLQDDDTLSVGGIQIDVHHTPGHSPGHVIFSIPRANALFVGDVIFAGSIGRTDLSGGDLNELLGSIRKSVFTYPDEMRLYPGHGPETTVGFERLHNPYLK